MKKKDKPKRPLGTNPDEPWFCPACRVWASDGHECEDPKENGKKR